MKMLECRLQEIGNELSTLYQQVREYQKNKIPISSGLQNAVKVLEQKQEAFKSSLDFWRIMQRVYPNYDR